ncbi:hypothetical protein [Rhodococcus phage REQ1]|uniref:hypothetical protein n=1 Tax=Rhodococcus phage REQ1 TaxID=1109712 RepID=UPI00023EEC5B|nr:hypothetical protein RoPhREQ1_gp57 [Rhodococcus phage REQ1]AEV52053.1 hypothetical protein [Rhodococcus phage REQ1]
MSKRSKHQKAAHPVNSVPETTSYVFHDAEPQISKLHEFVRATQRFNQDLPPYSPLEQHELVPYDAHEHDLLTRRISNQRRELRHLNRAYRRRSDELGAKVTLLKDQLKVSIKATQARNLKITQQQEEIDQLRRQLATATDGGRRKRGFRWAGK